MEAFLTFIFFTIVTLYLLGFVVRALLRYWLKKKFRQFGDGADFSGDARRRGGSGAPRSGRREGEITIEHTQRTDKKVRGNVGDYVDFEEIEEKSE